MQPCAYVTDEINLFEIVKVREEAVTVENCRTFARTVFRMPTARVKLHLVREAPVVPDRA